MKLQVIEKRSKLRKHFASYNKATVASYTPQHNKRATALFKGCVNIGIFLQDDAARISCDKTTMVTHCKKDPLLATTFLHAYW